LRDPTYAHSAPVRISDRLVALRRRLSTTVGKLALSFAD
jgi:hypothetical protein